MYTDEYIYNKHVEINNKLSLLRYKVKNINLGGCGFFAYEMYKKLWNHGINSDIILFGSKENPIHIFLQIDDDLYLDSDGINDFNKFKIKWNIPDRKYLSIITEEDLKYMLNNVIWNKSFNFHFQDNNFNIISNKQLLIEQINYYF